MKQIRYVSANYKRKFDSSIDFFEYMSEQIRCTCECDGRGCSVCIGADALGEAVQYIRILEAKLEDERLEKA